MGLHLIEDLVVVVAAAADVTLFTQRRDKIQALSLLQTAIDRVAEWNLALTRVKFFLIR